MSVRVEESALLALFFVCLHDCKSADLFDALHYDGVLVRVLSMRLGPGDALVNTEFVIRETNPCLHRRRLALQREHTC